MVANLHATSVPLDTLALAYQHLKDSYDLLKQYLLTLTPEERQDMLKASDKTSAFMDKANVTANQFPHLLPAFFDIEAFNIDYADTRNLREISNLSRILAAALNDTLMVANSETFKSSLSVYNSTSAAAALDVPGAKVIYEELKKRFPSRHRRNPASEEPGKESST